MINPQTKQLNPRESLPLLIGVGGGSGSGKTTLAARLAVRLAASVLTLDDYYHDLSHLSATLRQQHNYDHPDAVEWALLAEQLEALAIGRPVEAPRYDFETHTRVETTTLLRPKAALIVEGILALHDPNANAVYHLKVFVDAPEQIRFERRLKRDVNERGRTEASVREQFRATVKPMHDRFVEPTRVHADWIVDGTASIEDAADRIARAAAALSQGRN